MKTTADLFESTFQEHLQCFQALGSLKRAITAAGDMITRTLASGRKILICGNGGSAADAQHFAAEIVGRFTREREAWPALALSSDTSILTAVGNDYGFQAVFSRQVEALGRPGDLLIGISTSGRSPNVLEAVHQAGINALGIVALTGGDGGALAAKADVAITVPSRVTARIQEAHAFILHLWADTAEASLSAAKEP